MQRTLVLSIVFNFVSFNAGQFAGMDLKPMVSGPDGVGAIASMVNGFIGTNSSKCPPKFITSPEPCHCINIHTVINPPITWMEAAKYCQTKMDNRTILLNIKSQAYFATFDSQIGSYAPSLGVTNIPVGEYLAENGNIRSIVDQSLADFPNFVGKCKYFVPDANVSKTASCLTYVGAVTCQMPCDDFTYPPLPNTAQGTDRCNKADFNATCQSGWINLGGLCYKNPVDSNTLLTYSEAASKCQTIDGWLPSISNQKEWDAITKYVYTVGISGEDSFAAPMWLGGTLSGTTASWNDGTPWQFQYWAATEPKTTSSCMWWSVGQGDYWSAGNCTQPAVVFCQQYPQCITTSTSTTTTTKPTTTTSTTTTSSTSTSTSTTTTPKATSITTTTISIPTTLTTVTTPTTTITVVAGKSSLTTATLVESMYLRSTTAEYYNDIQTNGAASTTNTAMPGASSMPSTSSETTVKLTSAISGASTMPVIASTSTSTSSTVTTSSTQTQTTTTTFRTISDCQLNQFSFTENGVCYEIMMDSCPVDAHAGVVRSADIGQKLIELYKQGDPSSTSAAIWIGYQNNNASEYNVLQHSISTDASYTMMVDLNNAGQCPSFQWEMSNEYYMVINSSTPCSTNNQWYLCETWPTFQQKACNQSLITAGVETVITSVASSALECTQQCTMESWCMSVNYKPSEKSCQCLQANLASKTLVCDLGWNYYEKI